MKPITTIVILLFLLATVCHCSSEGHSEVISSQCHQNSSPVALAINEFGINLSKGMRSSENYFFSPLSTSVALAMTYLGARGQTAEQMEDALGYRSQNLTSAEVHEGFQNFITALRSCGNGYLLQLANGIFVQDRFTIKKEFIRNVTVIYRAVVRLVDFEKNGKKAVEEINRWVDQNTNHRIRKLFQKELDSSTRLVLLNAIYFKGTWKFQFPKNETRRGNFGKTCGSAKDVKFMFLSNGNFSYFDDPETKYKFLELPYRGDLVSMLLALPRDFNDTDDLILTSNILCRVNESMKVTKLETVSIPKFKMEYQKNLKRDLIALGMRDLFSAADLSGMRETSDLFVSQVIHKAVIEVDEEGSEAAAVAAVGVKMRSMSLDPSFIANHTFQFHIIDKRLGVVLFAGRVNNPRYENN